MATLTVREEIALSLMEKGLSNSQAWGVVRVMGNDYKDMNLDWDASYPVEVVVVLAQDAEDHAKRLGYIKVVPELKQVFSTEEILNVQRFVASAFEDRDND